MAGARIMLGTIVVALAGVFINGASVGADTLAHADSVSPNRTTFSLPLTYSDECAYPDEPTLAAIVQVATDHGSYASGVVFDNNRVLTAAHALQGGGRFFVRVSNGFRVADLVSVDHANDLAVLAVDTARIQPLRISLYSRPLVGSGYATGIWCILARRPLRQDGQPLGFCCWYHYSPVFTHLSLTRSNHST